VAKVSVGGRSPVDSVRDTYLEAAGYVLELLRDLAVAADWAEPSALAEMTVGALAAHLARQVLTVRAQLDVPAGAEPPLVLLDHYARAAWVGAALTDEANLAIRRSGELESADGPDVLASRVAAGAAELRAMLPAQPADRSVFLPWGPWSLTLDDMLRTRLMEIVVHGDDLACSVSAARPQPPAAAADEAVVLLARLAVRKHGAAALVRALSRAECAPGSITAI